jgi:hypothetical protein
MSMDKFSKRILSSSKNHRNCIVVGQGIGYLDNIVDSFQCVFIIDGNAKIRKRNVVYRESFDNIDKLVDIDFVFVDSRYFDNFKKLRPVWLAHRPIFFLEGSDLFGLENYKYFRSESYALTNKYKNMQKWIPL